jgi:hypothetical protein
MQGLCLLALILSLAGPFAPATPAAVPTADITLEPVVTDNLPLISSLTAYVYPNDSDAVSITLGGANVLYDAPLYYPFDTDTPAWWDNLVAEQLQARLPVVMFASRGTKTTNSTDIAGNMNPRQLTRMVDALQRANATHLFKLACFIDSPSLRGIYTYLHSLPSSTLLDMASAADWNDVFWLRGVKPWFDTVPRQYWFEVNGRPIIQWWSISSTWFTNQNGNAGRMLKLLADSFEIAYGVRPGFILHHTWPSLDPDSPNEPDVVGINNWFSPPSTAFTTNTFRGFTSQTAVPGFINPSYFDPTSANYQNPAFVIPHNNVDGTGANGDTLIAGLEAAILAKPHLAVLEGWNDVREWAGYYRCGSSPRYDFPSQYINLVRRYTDFRTRSLRLEAEGADAYLDTTAGNSGGAWRRFGDLDIRTLGTNGWTVTSTAPGEWIEFKEIIFSTGNYRFPVRYAALASHTLRLSIDGAPLPEVVLPATGGTNNFDTFYLGSAAVPHGVHTLRLDFVDGGVDVDWLFVKKYDPAVTFRSARNGCYLGAAWGGNDALICNWTVAGPWEQFTVDDFAGGGALFSGHEVRLQVYNGLYLTATHGGGAALFANQRTPSSAENFSILSLTGSGTLTNGSQVAIRTSAGYYLTVKSDGSVDAGGTSIGTAQTFTLETALDPPPIPPIPPAPAGLAATAASSQIYLSWPATPGATSYNLKRASLSGGPYATLARNVTATTTFIDFSPAAGTTYYYVVSAVNAGGESADSSQVAVTIPIVLSQGTPVTASSFQAGNDPFKGNDGDPATRWAASGPGLPQWWQVDLGTNYTLSSVAIQWYNGSSRAYGYQIAVSSNNTNFTTVIDKSGNTALGDTADTFSAVARYVRITVTSCTQPGGYASFYECKVYGTSVPTIALNPTHLTAVLTGNVLKLSWPADHLGWRLEVQTNTLATGLSTNWVTLPGCDRVTSTNILIHPANGAVLYRMAYP